MKLASLPPHPATGDCSAVIASDGDVALVSLAGELDRSNAAWLGELLDSSLAVGWSTVRIDMSGVTFIDGASISAVAVRARRCVAHGQRVEIAQPSSPVRRLVNVLDWTWLLGPAQAAG